MTLAAVARWLLYLFLAFAAGLLVGLPAGVRSGQIQKVEAQVATSGFPLVEFSDSDYQPENRVVPTFGHWAQGPLGANLRRLYPPYTITPDQQRELASRVIVRAERQGELNNVIIGCAIHAITQANQLEASQARQAGDRDPQPATLIGYAEKAEYFGQDVWCFLCLSSADRRQGTLRVMVMSASPDFGLIHAEKFNPET